MYILLLGVLFFVQTFDDVALRIPHSPSQYLFLFLWKGWSYHKRQLSNSLVHNTSKDLRRNTMRI